jgi:hypothetical protein
MPIIPLPKGLKQEDCKFQGSLGYMRSCLKKKKNKRKRKRARYQWLTPVILATQEAEIRKITL